MYLVTLSTSEVKLNLSVRTTPIENKHVSRPMKSNAASKKTKIIRNLK